MLSAAQARRAIVWAHFEQEPVADALGALHQLGALQLDPISRVEKAHRLTTIARMPVPRAPRDPVALDAGLWDAGPARSFEGPVHAMCLLPLEDWPLWHERRGRSRARWHEHDFLEEIDRILVLLSEAPAGLRLGELEVGEATRGWDYSLTKHVVESLVHMGRVVVTERRGGKRVYDLPERRIPAELLHETPDAETIDLAFARRALAVAGLGALPQLAKAWMRPQAGFARALDALVASGEAERVEVEGWDVPTYASSSALAAPAASRRVHFVGPFDPFLNRRAPLRRAFGVEYLFEAYVPAAKRVVGPYALCAVVDDRVVAHVDLRADRRRGVLELVALSPLVPRVPTARIHAALPGFARALGLRQAEVEGVTRPVTGRQGRERARS